MDNTREAQIFFVGSTIASLVGAILMLATDFGGWYIYGVEYGYIYANFTITGIIIILMDIMFWLCFFISIAALAKPDILPDNALRSGLYLALVILILTIIGASIFAVEMIDLDPTNWWLDASFYGALIGSILTVIFFYLALLRMEISPIPKL